MFRRDFWLCRWCKQPVIFPPAMKLLEEFARASAITNSLASFHPNWRRDATPLLDQLGASVDHVKAQADGGTNDIENLATICQKDNVRKGKLPVEEHLRRYPAKPVPVRKRGRGRITRRSA